MLDKGMVYIPEGNFLYGDYKQEVYLSGYWISKRPITNKEYYEFVLATEQKPPIHWVGNQPPEEIIDHPVVYVFWDDAMAYAKWRKCRLPTEFEWEKAARGDDGRWYPWGSHVPTTLLCNFGMHIATTTAVGAYSPQGDSPYGCADMSGNVLEWTDSWYDEFQKYRIVRGGAFRYRSKDIRATSRYSLLPTFRYNDVGFRIAC